MPPPDPSPLSVLAADRRALFEVADATVIRALRMLGRARALAAADRAASLSLLVARRERLARHLQQYQRFKHRSVFDPVIAHGTASSKLVARTMKTDCIMMGEQFGAYHGRWARVAAADWAGYRDDTLAVSDRLLAHLEGERRAIGQLLMIAEFHAGLEARAAA